MTKANEHICGVMGVHSPPDQVVKRTEINKGILTVLQSPHISTAALLVGRAESKTFVQ